MGVALHLTISDRPLHRNSPWQLRAAIGETPVNVFDRSPLGFEPDEGVSTTSKRRPGPEIDEARKNYRHAHVTLNDIRRTDDHHDPERTHDTPYPTILA